MLIPVGVWTGRVRKLERTGKGGGYGRGGGSTGRRRWPSEQGGGGGGGVARKMGQLTGFRI